MSELERQLVALLSASPGMSAREIASLLRGRGLDVHKHDINPLMYGDARFENDHGRIPRWRLAGAASTSAFTRDARGAAKRTRRAALDRRQDAVAAVRGGAGAAVGDGDDALRQALALLRSRGYHIPDLGSPLASRTTAAEPPQPAAQVRSRTPAPQAADPSRPGVAARRTLEPRAPLRLPGWTLRLRAWQEEALRRWYDAGGTGVCEAVTGTGKTHLGLEAVAQCLRLGERATVLVPSVLLQRQWEQQLQAFVPEAVIAKVGGVTRGDARHADVVIAVVNSALKNDLTVAGANMTLLVADEVHRYGGQAWSEALRQDYQYRLGLTATLERGSDEGVAEVLLPYFGGIVHHYGFDRATREEVVAPFDLVFLGVKLEDEERATYEALSRKISDARKVLIAAGGDPAKLNQQLAALGSIGGKVTNAVIAYKSATRDRRALLADTRAKQDGLEALTDVVGESGGTVVFTQSKQTADDAASILQVGGLRAAAIYSEGMTPARRQALIDALGDEELDALAAPRILDEGIDIPDIDLGIVMGASSTRRQMIQRLGRVIRLKRDGRRARFVVLYATDSVEDPEHGGRDDFLAEVQDAASKTVLYREWDEHTIDEVWSGASPAWQPDHEPASPSGGGTLAPPPFRAGVRPIQATPAVQARPLDQPAPRPAVEDPVAPAPPAPPPPLPSPPRQAPPARPAEARQEVPAVPFNGESTQPPQVPRPPVARLSRPSPRPRRPEYPDPLQVADLLALIDESTALVEWVRAELDAEMAG